MTPLFKKLNFKNHPSILIINAPESFQPEMKEMAAETTIATSPDELSQCGFIMAFVTRQQEIDALVPILNEKLEGDGILWFCYPKGSSKKYKCDFNRDTGWNTLGTSGFEGVRMVAIDEDWSALRFRRADYIKTMTRSFARSEAGKEKVTASKGKKPQQ